MFIAFNACPQCGNHLNSEGGCPICEHEVLMCEEETHRANMRGNPRKLPVDADIIPERAKEE